MHFLKIWYLVAEGKKSLVFTGLPLGKRKRELEEPE